jgi:hypothetical protein
MSPVLHVTLSEFFPTQSRKEASADILKGLQTKGMEMDYTMYRKILAHVGDKKISVAEIVNDPSVYGSSKVLKSAFV